MHLPPSFMGCSSFSQPAWKRALVPVLSVVAVLAVGIAAWQLLFAGGSAAPLDTGLNPSHVAVLYFQDIPPGEDLEALQRELSGK